jgi:hypothetical protein
MPQLSNFNKTIFFTKETVHLLLKIFLNIATSKEFEKHKY